MTAIHSQAPYGGWRRVWYRPRRASRLVERALAAVRDWRRGETIGIFATPAFVLIPRSVIRNGRGAHNRGKHQSGYDAKSRHKGLYRGNRSGNGRSALIAFAQPVPLRNRGHHSGSWDRYTAS
jgi:hypothetical protein